MDNARNVFFVGSYPADNAHQAMFEILQVAEQNAVPLLCVPDGETGPRSNWSRDENTALLASHPALREAMAGKNYTNWEDLPEAEILDPNALTPDSLRVRLDYTYYAHQALLALKGLQSFGLGKNVPLQVGVPAAFDLAMSVLGRQAMGHVSAFQEAIGAHLRDIYTLDPTAIMQLETPVALNLVNAANPHMPEALQPEALSKSITDTVALAPEGARIGLHFCFGDLNNEGRIPEAISQPSVTFANAIYRNWPEGRTLEYVHIPLASGKNPPVLKPEIYAALGDLELPENVRIIAGIAHEAQSPAEQLQALQLVERALGRSVDIAAACGLGRRTLSNARLVAQRMIQLAKS